MSDLWYKNGLQFGCQQCGRCCAGEPGYVWVNEPEIASIASELGLSILQFEMTFVRTIPRLGKSLLEFENGDCSLLDPETGSCRVYHSRPRQCRTWPFWSRNLDSPNSWKKTAKFCPGCNRGPLHSCEEIEQARKKMEI